MLAANPGHVSQKTEYGTKGWKNDNKGKREGEMQDFSKCSFKEMH